MTIEVEIGFWTFSLTGLVEEGGTEGVFKSLSGSDYAGQFKDNASHGKGVMRFQVLVLEGGYDSYCGDWDDGYFTGHGEAASFDGATYRGQWSRSLRHGYGEYVDVSGKYQGQWEDDLKHGPIRRTTPDGSVNDTIWESDQDTGVPCNADDAVANAEEGLVYLSLLFLYDITFLYTPNPAALKGSQSAYDARCIVARIKGVPEPEKPGLCVVNSVTNRTHPSSRGVLILSLLNALISNVKSNTPTLL